MQFDSLQPKKGIKEFGWKKVDVEVSFSLSARIEREMELKGVIDRAFLIHPRALRTMALRSVTSKSV